MGLVGMLAGLVLGLVSLGQHPSGSPELPVISVGQRHDFLVGVQLLIYWILLRVLDELSQPLKRERKIWVCPRVASIRGA